MNSVRKFHLAETHPELVAQADVWNPANYTSGQKNKVAWKCEVGHPWSSLLASCSRCSVFSNKIVLAGINVRALSRRYCQ